jgi:CheY-like chemotaxis protein
MLVERLLWRAPCSPGVIVPRASHPTSPTTILVADDDEDMLALVSMFLRTDGYTVLEARDGHDLLEQLQQGMEDPKVRPDVVVADIMMPRLSGLGVLDALRRAQVNIPVILMTVLADHSVHLVARRLGAVGVLRKPFDATALRAAVVGACLAYSSMRPPPL